MAPQTDRSIVIRVVADSLTVPAPLSKLCHKARLALSSSNGVAIGSEPLVRRGRRFQERDKSASRQLGGFIMFHYQF